MLLFLFLFVSAIAHSKPASEDIVDKAIGYMSDKYLWVDQMDANEAFVDAAESAEDAIPWLIVEPTSGGIQLKHGVHGKFADIFIENLTYDDLVDALHELETKIRSGPGEIPKDVDLTVELLSGVADQLDRFSVVMHKDKLRRFNERIQGRLSGIGCRIQAHPLGLRITEVFPDGPAEDRGLTKNDVISHIDNASIKGITVEKAVSRLRGKSGTKVSVRIIRDGEEPRVVPLVRRSIRIPNVRWRVESGGIGVIRIKNFSRQTYQFLNQALADFRFERDLKGIIIDLRKNSGGSLIQACRAVDLFVKSGIALTTEGRNRKPAGKLIPRYKLRAGSEPPQPIIVLIDSKSASAAEILAGALKLNERALLIGQQTYGKGVVQMPYTLRGGGAKSKVTLKLTVAQYLLKDRFSVHDEKGIEPHLYLTPITFRKSLAYIPPQIKGLVYGNEKEGWRSKLTVPLIDDYPLEFAMRLLRQNPPADQQGLLKAAQTMSTQVQKEEWKRIEDSFAVANIDWTADDERGPPNDDISIDLSLNRDAVGGEPLEIVARVCNGGKKDLYRASIRLESERGPWRNKVIPIGRVPAGETVSGKLQLTPSNRYPGRRDLITPVLRSHRQQDIALPQQHLDLKGHHPPVVDAKIEIIEVKSGEYSLILSVLNKENNDLKKVRVRLGLPNSPAISFISDGVIQMNAIPAQETRSIEYKFRSKSPLDTLGEFEVKVDANGFKSVLKHTFNAKSIVDGKYLSAPKIMTELPTFLHAGSHVLKVALADDGSILQATVWMNGEKIAFSEKKTNFETPLLLDIGVNDLLIEATDDMGIKNKRRHRILVTETPDIAH